MLAALLATAGAADYQSDLEDALLARALGDHATAAARLEQIVKNGAAEDPARAWALSWLATTRIEAGDSEGARAALRECLRIGEARTACMEQLGRLEVHSQAITRVPTVWDFDGAHGIVQAWTQTERGALRVETRGGDPALIWTSTHDERSPGLLLFAVHEAAPTPSTFVARVRSEGRDGWLSVVFVDVHGVDRVQPEIPLPADQPVVVEIELANARHVGAPPLDPGEIDLVLLHDATALKDLSGGASVLVFDDVGLR